MLQRLYEEDFDQIYELMAASFVPVERRNYEEQKALFADPAYRVFGLKEEETGGIKAFLALWELDGFTYGEHFAVSPKWRNGGVGARILKEVMETVPGMFCLEVELPKDELSKRRIRFYERNGFFLNPYPYVQPPLSDGQEELPLQIMTAGNPISLENFRRIRDTLYERVYHCRLGEDGRIIRKEEQGGRI